MIKITSNQFLFFRMFYMIFEIQTSFPRSGVQNTNILVPTLTFHVLWRLPKLFPKICKCLTTSDHPFKFVQFFKNFTFKVCKPLTHLDYLLDLKQIGGQSTLSCIKTKIKWTGYFLWSVRPKRWGVEVEEGREEWREGENLSLPQSSGGYPPSPLTLVSFAFVDLPESFTYRYKQ